MQIEPERPAARALQGMTGQRPVFGHGLTIGQYGRHAPIVPRAGTYSARSTRSAMSSSSGSTPNA